MKKKFDQQLLDTMSRDLGNWHGPFYSNRKDPRLIVPKYNPMMGWTFNFASPYTYVMVIAIILIIVCYQLFL